MRQPAGVRLPRPELQLGIVSRITDALGHEVCRRFATVYFPRLAAYSGQADSQLPVGF